MNLIGLAQARFHNNKTPFNRFIKKLLKDDKGLFRGFDLGQNMDVILQNENFKVFEYNDHHIGFNYSTKNGELIDITYFKNHQNNLEKIQVEVYLNHQDDCDIIFESLHYELFKKHGFPTVLDEKYFWNLTGLAKISLFKRQNIGDNGISILYEK